MNQIEITKEKFRSYRAIQKSGICNMMDVKTALFWLNNGNRLSDDDAVGCKLVKLTEEQYKEILFNYGKYWEKYVEKN